MRYRKKFSLFVGGISLSVMIILLIWKVYHYHQAQQFEYQGILVLKRINEDLSSEWVFMNPNNRNDFVRIHFPVRCVSVPLLRDDGSISVISEQNGVFTLNCFNAHGSWVRKQLSISCNSEKHVWISWGRIPSGYVIAQETEEPFHSFSFYSVDESGECTLLARDIRRYLMCVNDIVAWHGNDGRIYWSNGRSVAMPWRWVDGFFRNGQEFLVYEYKQGSIIVNSSGEVIQEYSCHPYRVLGNGPDALVLEMTSRNSGGYDPLGDVDWSLKGWLIQTDRQRFGTPFLYNWELDDVINIPKVLEDGTHVLAVENVYQSASYSGKQLQSLKDAIESMYCTFGS